MVTPIHPCVQAAVQTCMNTHWHKHWAHCMYNHWPWFLSGMLHCISVLDWCFVLRAIPISGLLGPSVSISEVSYWRGGVISADALQCLWELQRHHEVELEMPLEAAVEVLRGRIHHPLVLQQQLTVKALHAVKEDEAKSTSYSTGFLQLSGTCWWGYHKSITGFLKVNCTHWLGSFAHKCAVGQKGLPSFPGHLVYSSRWPAIFLIWYSRFQFQLADLGIGKIQ